MTKPTDTEQMRMILADIIMSAVLHPENDHYEVVGRAPLDQARFVLDRDDINKAAARGRARRALENEPK